VAAAAVSACSVRNFGRNAGREFADALDAADWIESESREVLRRNLDSAPSQLVGCAPPRPLCCRRRGLLPYPALPLFRAPSSYKIQVDPDTHGDCAR
jgi:hypothetical protein